MLVSAQTLFGTLHPSMKRSAYDAIGPEELRAMLQKAKKRVSILEHRLLEQERCQPVCNYEMKVMPSGPRDNGEFIYVCTKCGRMQ